VFKAQVATKPVLRDIAIIRFFFDLGLRQGEVCGLKVSDLNAAGLHVRRKRKFSKAPLFRFDLPV
jgi:integrase